MRAHVDTSDLADLFYVCKIGEHVASPASSSGDDTRQGPTPRRVPRPARLVTARIESEGRRLSDDLHLSQLRKARGLTQETMADLLGVSQAEVSKMERRTELYVGTLRKFIEAMNGELVLAARFSDGVEIPIQLTEAEADALSQSRQRRVRA
jgi:DNA-binding XRE family transcriptional regulator